MKTILILSSEPWGKMMLSKMHFARELSSMGNRVFFANPPRSLKQRHKTSTEPVQSERDLTLIHIKEHPLRIIAREKMQSFYRWIEQGYVKEIMRHTGKIDELWCFNPHFISDLDLFGADKTLLLVYDLYQGKHLITAAKKSDAIISVAQNILDVFENVQKPRLLLNHGLAPAFGKAMKKANVTSDTVGKIRLGYVGNLLRTAIDVPVFRQIIEEHPELEFHFWGPSGIAENNVSGKSVNEEMRLFNIFLEQQKNVILHGVKTPERLAQEIQAMDAFLFVYHADRDMNAASNSHKLIEYLSTGKAVYASHISTYNGTGLMVMAQPEEQDFCNFFRTQIKNISTHNAPDIQQKRISFALANTYRMQVARIYQFTEGNGSVAPRHNK